jgi:hypothetical protein
MNGTRYEFMSILLCQNVMLSNSHGAGVKSEKKRSRKSWRARKLTGDLYGNTVWLRSTSFSDDTSGYSILTEA